MGDDPKSSVVASLGDGRTTYPNLFIVAAGLMVTSAAVKHDLHIQGAALAHRGLHQAGRG